MWIEKGKTILLNLLVLISLLLSWFLINSQPKYDYLHPAQYVEQQSIGDKMDVKQLVKPQSMIFHYGNKRFTGALPDTTYYRIVSREMEKWYFFNFKKVQLSRESEMEIMNEHKALEIIYPTEIPKDILGELFTFRGSTDSILSSVKRIVIYIDETDKETYAMFEDNEGNQVQARTAITSRDLEQFYLSLGSTLPSMMPITVGNGEELVYIPSQAFSMDEYRYFFQPIGVPQMLQKLFVDPSMIRQVTERDGTIIYTDGSKAVQLPSSLHSIHFHDPIADSIESSNADNNFHSAVNFVNEHGGWNGFYLLEDINKIQHDGVDSYQFRQYVNSYPLFGDSTNLVGDIEVVTQRSYVSGFHRSLLSLDTFFDHQTQKVFAGEELLSKLNQLGIQLRDVQDLYIGYQAKMNDNHLILTPNWIIQRKGKEPLLIEAKQTSQKEESHGLEKSKDHSNTSLPSTR